MLILSYRQLTSGERYMLAALGRQGLNQAEIARALGRHHSTVCREVRRNSTRADGHYRPRRNRRFCAEDFARVDELLCRQWSPEQVAGYLRRQGQLLISHETIYRHAWRDKKAGELLRRRRGIGRRRAQLTLRGCVAKIGFRLS